MMIQVGDGPRGLRRRGTKQEEKKEHLNEGLGYQ